MTPFPRRPDAEPLVALFEARGAVRVEADILQPTELFLDLSGEDIRRRLFLTQDQDGRELCLRPEYTIPVCRGLLAEGRAAGAYCYHGPVFRQRSGAAGEFLQAGFELLGDDDRADADARAVALALDGLALFAGPFAVRIGDTGLLAALLDGLRLPSAVRRRIVRDLAAGRGVAAALEPVPRGGGGDYAGLLAAIAGRDPNAARAFIEDVMAIAGVAQIGGRRAGEIAERFLAKAEARDAAVSDESRQVLAAYAAVTGTPDEAAATVADLARGAGLELGRSVDGLARRADAFRCHGVAADSLMFRADFVRSLDYYTGLVFEVRREGEPDIVAAGGRYDGLLQHLGAAAPVPAVGCSFWMDRLRGSG